MLQVGDRLTDRADSMTRTKRKMSEVLNSQGAGGDVVQSTNVVRISILHPTTLSISLPKWLCRLYPLLLHGLLARLSLVSVDRRSADERGRCSRL